MKRDDIIAGPCSAESRSQVLATAESLRAMGITRFRAGLWKPRTHPGSFEGVGEQGLSWLVEVQQRLQMTVMTEVATAAHVEACLQAGIRDLWIGARTTANPFAVQQIADALRGCSDVSVMVKNPVSPDLELWVGALQRLSAAGIKRLSACHRGFTRYGEKTYRNSPIWTIPIELQRRYPKLPIVCDPSHIAGRRDLIAPLAQTAVDMDYAAMMIECHCNPDDALSDANQQLTPEALNDILTHLHMRSDAIASSELDVLRKKIDECDNELIDILLRRMEISREIGRYKKRHNMAAVQINRHDEIMQQRIARAQAHGLNPDVMKRLLAVIHEESVAQQLDVLSTDPSATPGTPATPENPENPENPGTPGTPGTPETPETPENLENP